MTEQIKRQNKLSSPLRVLTWSISNETPLEEIFGDVAFEVIESPDLTEEQWSACKEYWGVSDEVEVEIKTIALTAFPSIRLRLVIYNTEDPKLENLQGIRGVQFSTLTESFYIYRTKGLTLSIAGLRRLQESEKTDCALVSISSIDYVEEVEFYTKVLGMTASLVSDHVMINHPSSGEFYIHLSQLEDHVQVTEPTPRLPYFGWVMTSYETRDIGELLARAHASQNKVYRTPRKVMDPLLGSVIAMQLLTPNGMVVEVFQRA